MVCTPVLFMRPPPWTQPMMTICLFGTLFLIGCGGDATTTTDGDAGVNDGAIDDGAIDDGAIDDGAIDADICDTVTCECEADEDCAEHEMCDTSSGPGRICVCVPAYEDNGSGCEFAGAPLAPGFGDPVPWTPSGGAILDPAAMGNDDAGEVRWSGDAICDDSSVSQTFAMPPYALAEPLAFEITYGGNIIDYEARPQVAFNEHWSRFPRRDPFVTQASCLGEAGFDGDVQFRVDGYSRFCPSSSSADELVVDRLEVVRAQDVGLDCPAPGVMRDGDFEGDGTAWSTVGDASVQDGVGQNGTRGARLQTATRCSLAAVTGVASMPLSTTMASQALRFFWNGTPARALQVLADDLWVAEVSATGAAAVSTVCLPPHTRGLARSISFALPPVGGTCTDPDVRDFVIDTVQVLSDADCGEDPFILDGDFEFEVSGTVAGGWRLSGGGTGGTVGVVAGNAQRGDGSLRFTMTQSCVFLSARATMVVPKPDGTGGPALKYFYQAGDNPQTTLESVPGSGPLPDATAGFVEQTVCLQPALATRPLELVFRMQRPGGTCDMSFPEEETFIDNVRLTTDPACPSE